MDKQAAYDKACSGLKGQNFERSLALDMRGQPTGGCAYIGKDGMRCAIGHLLKDDEDGMGFTEIENHLGIEDSIGVQMQLEVDEQDFDTIRFLSKLQDCHDGAETPDQMKASLETFAFKNNLKPYKFEG